MATQQKDLQLWRAQHNTSTSITLGSYIPLEISFYCNNAEQMFPKLTLERPFSSKQLWGRAPGKQGYELANGVNTWAAMISLVLEMMWHQLQDCLQKERAGPGASQHDVNNCGWELQPLRHKRSPYYLCASRSTKWSPLSVGSFSCHSKIILFRLRAQSRTELGFSHMHWGGKKHLKRGSSWLGYGS